MSGRKPIGTTLAASLVLAATCARAGIAAAQAVPRPALIRSARSGPWSAPSTWEGGQVPGPGDRVQIRAGDTVRYDADSDQAIRSIHVAGTLTFARDRDTRLDVGLLKVQPGSDAGENGFDCDAHVQNAGPGAPQPALEVGTAQQPIPAGHTARIRLVYFEGMDKESCPAIVSCGGRMEFHGAPLNRTWVKLGATAREGDTQITLAEPVAGWREGDHVILTATQREPTGSPNGTFRPDPLARRTSLDARLAGLSDASRAAIEARAARVLAEIAIKFSAGPPRGKGGEQSKPGLDPAVSALLGARTLLWGAENAERHHAPGKEAAITGVIAAQRALGAAEAASRRQGAAVAETALPAARARLAEAEAALARPAPDREATAAGIAAARAAIAAAEAAGIRTAPDDEAAARLALERILGSLREPHPLPVYTEERTIRATDGRTVTLDRPLSQQHLGTADYRGEVADLSRNVIVESADPAGVRGHTMYHRGSAGSISYAEFRHLGKEGVLGRYSLHFHLVGDTMRGSSVVGASIWDSANRWLTVHGTSYLVVRDCVGYQSVGHGFYVEDGTESYNVFDRNLAVQAFQAMPLPKQNLPFDTNDGAGFWWANCLNTFTGNVACECDGYGYRFEATPMEGLDLRLPVRQADGSAKSVDIRTLPFVRFEGNEAHSILYGLNLGEGIDNVGPDTRHPLVVRNTHVWNAQWAFRPDAPSMIVDGMTIDQCRYGVFKPIYDHHAYRDLAIHQTETPSTDAFLRVGQPPEGLVFPQSEKGKGPRGADAGAKRLATEERRPSPNGTGDPGPTAGKAPAKSDFPPAEAKRRSVERAGDPLAGQAPGPPAAPITTARFPEPLDPVDDLPPATVITFVESPAPGTLVVRGTTSDNGSVRRVQVNGHQARPLEPNFAQWEVKLDHLQPGKLQLTAFAEDAAGNRERVPHELSVVVSR